MVAAASETVAEVRRAMLSVEYDMEVSLLAAALHSMRKTMLTNPFPKHFHSADGDRDYQALAAAAARLPSAEELYSGGVEEAARGMGEGVRELLQFILAQRNLREIPVGSLLGCFEEEAREGGYVPQRAFEVVHDSGLARTREFEERAAEFPAQVGFHGSLAENWFSILKNGLCDINKLQKRKPTHGAMFGEGIYLARSYRLATDFSKSGKGWASSEIAEHFRVVAVVEWLATPSVRTSESASVDERLPEKYVVVPQSSDVRLKAIAVYATKPPASKAAVKADTVRKQRGWLGVAFAVLVLMVLVAMLPEGRLLLRRIWRQSQRQWKMLLTQF